MYEVINMGYEQFINYLAVDYYESRDITPTQNEIDKMERTIIFSVMQMSRGFSSSPPSKDIKNRKQKQQAITLFDAQK